LTRISVFYSGNRKEDEEDGKLNTSQPC